MDQPRTSARSRGTAPRLLPGLVLAALVCGAGLWCRFCGTAQTAAVASTVLAGAVLALTLVLAVTTRPRPRHHRHR